MVNASSRIMAKQRWGLQFIRALQKSNARSMQSNSGALIALFVHDCFMCFAAPGALQAI
jgi:hypothetical protein